MNYREATVADSEQIATLHAQSWRQTYRGILLDEYLDGAVMQDRLAVWQERLTAPAPNQRILVAEENGQILGFACMYGDTDPQWGSLLDNLHVNQLVKGRGVGTELILRTAQWIKQQQQYIGLYLWVYEKNQAARRFYENLGAEHVETQVLENPGGGKAVACRYVWRKAEVFRKTT